jgi:hypothetical protein
MGQSQSVLALRTAAACLLASALAGCRTSQTELYERGLPVGGIVYESQGEIAAVRVAAPEGHEQAFIWEWIGGLDAVSADPAVSGEVLRLVQLDLATRQATLLREAPCRAFPFIEPGITVSADGRYASIEVQVTGIPGGSRVLVGEWDQEWTPVTSWQEGDRAMPQWSPDGTALTYVSVGYDESLHVASVDAVAIALPRRSRIATEIVLTRSGRSCLDMEWAPDSQRVYLMSRGPDDGDYLLEAVGWPALTRQTLMATRRLWGLSVARASHDVLVLEVQDRQSGETADSARVVVWRLRPDGTVEETAVRLDRLPGAAIVSPDGQRLAVLLKAEDSDPILPEAGGLVVYQLADGSSQRFDASSGLLSRSIHWVFGGRAVLFPEDRKRIRIAVIEP